MAHDAGSRSAGASESLNLTAGVEFEFILLQDVSLEDNIPVEDKTAGRTLVHSILAQPLKTTCATCGAEHTFNLPLNPLGSLLDYLSKDPRYAKWSIDEDQSLYISESSLGKHAHLLEQVYCYPIEIKSRVLSLTKKLQTQPDDRVPGHVHEITVQQEIEAVLNGLREAFKFPNAPPGWRLVTNTTCGYHVHIGNGRRGFPPSTLKKLLCAYVACERAIDFMHATSRISGCAPPGTTRTGPKWSEAVETLPGEAYNMPWSSLFIMFPVLRANNRPGSSDSTESIDYDELYPARCFDQDPELRQAAQQNDVQAWLTILDRAQTIKDLQDLQNEFCHTSTVNLQNLDGFTGAGGSKPRRKLMKMTVEFRQHAGTLRPHEANAWVDFLSKLFLFAHEKSEAEIRAFCAGEWARFHHDALDLMKQIAVSDQTYEHYQQRLHPDVPRERTYASRMAEQELEEARLFGEDNDLFPLVRYCIEETLQETLPMNVEDRVDRKFLAGCYGQFSTEYLKELDLQAARKERLTIGWRPALP